MFKRLASLAVAAIATLAGCGESPTGTSDEALSPGEIVVTRGAAVPARAPQPLRPSLSEAAAAANVGGSSTTALALKQQSCAPGNTQTVVVTYTVTGRQQNAASFKVNTRWEFNGTAWAGSVPTTVDVAPREARDDANAYQVTLTVVNASSTGTGTSSLTVVPSDLVTSSPAALTITDATVTVHVAFELCPVTNTAPTLVLPSDMTVEATSSAGAAVSFVVTASDLEDGILTSSVTCTPASGSTFALGETTVNCSVTDGGGLTTVGSFKVTVVDTTPAYFTSIPTATVNLIAADINGAVLDIGSLGITVADVGNVSEPSTFECDYVTGTVLGIGGTTTVSCTATDATGNESDPSSFDVFVGLNVTAAGFLPPLRMVAPFSVHKRGSTIPHKFLPPAYADGTPALDLADGLTLVLKRLDGTVGSTELEVNDYTAGSTTWRYDLDGGQYIFNLKTGTASPWDVGTWRTTVSYKGITLATTQLDLKK